jgi:hypothetical protein
LRLGNHHRGGRSRRLAVALSFAIFFATLGRTSVVGARSIRAHVRGTDATLVELITSGCGTIDILNERVRRRSRQVRLVDSAREAKSPSLRAEIKDVGDSRREITLTAPKRVGPRQSRHLYAQDCNEALEALALLIVLATDPAAAAGERDSAGAPITSFRGSQQVTDMAPPSQDTLLRRARLASVRGLKRATEVKAGALPKALPDTSPVASVRGDRDSSAPSAPSDTPSTPPGLRESDRAPAADRVERRVGDASQEEVTEVASDRVRSIESESATQGRRTIALGVGGLAIVGPAPAAMAGESVYAAWGWNRNSFWSPVVALTASHAERNGFATTGGTADFTLDSLQFELCPISLGLQGRLGVRACGMGVAGQLAARGGQTVAAQGHTRPFGLFGGSAAVVLHPAWRVEMMLTGGVGVPLQRYAFQFEPAVFYRASAVSLTGGLTVGVRFF